MWRWQLVIDRDRQIDLTSPDRGRAWAYLQMVGIFRPGGRELGDGEGVGGAADYPGFAGWFDGWVRNVRALRSLVGRLTRTRTKSPEIDPAEADAVLHDYLSRVRVHVLKVVPRPTRGRRGAGNPVPDDVRTVEELVAGKPDFSIPDAPLSRETFAGLAIRTGDQPAEPGHYPQWAFDQFWQDVFLSLLDDRFSAPVCRRCGEPLPPTLKGRPSRRAFCAGCRSRQYREQASRSPERQEELRRKWREQQARHREKAKEPAAKKRNKKKG